MSRGQANDALTDGYVPYVPLHLLRHPPFSIIILICPPFALSFVWSRGRWVSSRVHWKTRTANYASFVPLPPSLELSRQAQTFPKNTCWKLCVCVCLKPSHRTLRVIYSWFRVTSHSSAKVLRWYIFFKSAMKYLSLDNDVTWEYWPRELGTFVTGLKRRHQYTRTLGSLFVVRFRVVILNAWKILSGQLKPSCILELDL